MPLRSLLCTAIAVLCVHSLPACGAAPITGERGRGLTVCLADANAPFSASTLPDGGSDADLARNLANQLGRDFRLQWITIPNRGGLGKALTQNLAGGVCDLFAGVPESGGPNEDLVEKRMLASTPYQETGYALVSTRKTLRSLDDLRRLGRIGVVTATPADLYLFQQHLHRVPYGSNADLLAALDDGAVDAAAVWQPALAEERRLGKAQVTAELPLPTAGRTRFVFALRAGDLALLAEVNSALAQLKGSGRLAEILQAHGLAP